jgi:hypothetical protein
MAFYKYDAYIYQVLDGVHKYTIAKRVQLDGWALQGKWVDIAGPIAITSQHDEEFVRDQIMVLQSLSFYLNKLVS